MSASAKAAAIEALQRALNLDPLAVKATDGGMLVVDGIPGRNTRLAYQAASPAIKTGIDRMVIGYGFQIDDLLKVKGKTSKRKVLTEEVRAAVKEACDYWGVNLDLALTFASMESNFDPDAYNSAGNAWGLFQTTRWAVAQLRMDRPRDFFEAPRGDWRDLKFNCHVGVYYIRWCAERAKVSPMTSNTKDWVDIYGHYNLGTGAYSAWKAGRYNSKIVTTNWQTQAAPLRKGGVEAYASNVHSYIISHMVG